MASSSNIALKSFSLANDVLQVSSQDEIFKYDKAANTKINIEAPWGKDPHYFKKCRISAIALIKMVIHARSGVPHEIMGLMQGKVMGDAIIVMDSFALPVQGTETRVNAANEAYEYMVEYIQGSEKFQDPFVAVVIDPNRTISAGKVDIGAFRTYPPTYTPPNAVASEYQSIPLNKIEDFGVHANQYYQLEVEVFTSELDQELLGLLWNKYWVNTLSQSPLISNREYAVSQLSDLHQKLAKAQGAVASTRAPIPSLKDDKMAGPGKKDDKKKEEHQLAKSVRDSTKIAVEAQHGLIAQVLKDVIFSMRPRGANVPIPDDVNRVGDVVDTAMSVE
ncbi:hypothetical protein HWV62_21430 [Athelia sp. TMB]|nr:hypothetical protein HWV62_21430 [Athelia sp. TMB]